MIERLGRWVGIVAAIAAIIGLILTYLNCKVENAKLENKVTELEDEVQGLQLELEGTRTIYHSLLIKLITEGKIYIKEIEPFLPEEEVKKVKREVSAIALSLPANVDVYFYPSGWVTA